MLVAKKMLKTVTIDYLSTLTDISDIQEADFKNLMEAAKEQAKVMLEKFEVKCKKNKVGVEIRFAREKRSLSRNLLHSAYHRLPR